MPGKKKSGQEISVYLPYEKIEEIERVKGPYITTSKFILWCLNQVLETRSGKERTPLGAKVGDQAPNVVEDSSNIELNTRPAREGLLGVS